MLRRKDNTTFPVELRVGISHSDLRPLLFVVAHVLPGLTSATPNGNPGDTLVQALQNTNLLLGSDLDLEMVLDHILASVQRIVSCDAANIMLVEAGVARVVRCRGYAERGSENDVLNLRLPLSEFGVVEKMTRTGDPFAVDDIRTFSGWVDVPSMRWIRSHLSIPILSNAQVIGFLSLDSALPNRITNEHIAQLLPLADQTAIALKEARILTSSQRRVRELSALINIISSINSTLELEWVLRLAMREVQDLFQVERCSFIMIDEQTDELVFRARAESPNDPFQVMHLGPGQGIAGWVAREGKPALVNHVQADPRWHPQADAKTGFQTRSILAVPLKSGGKIIGVLEAINKASGDFSEDDSRLLDSISMAVGQAIENARLFGELNKAYQETGRQQTLILSSRNTLRAVFDGITDTVCLVNQNLQIIALNRTAAEEVSEDIRSLIGQDCNRLICKSERTCDECLIKKTFQAGEPVMETNVRLNKHGTKRELEEHTFPIENAEGVIDRVVYIARDITEKRKMEAVLIESAKLSAVGQLAAGVAHEINNPMAAIIGNAQMLLESVAPDDPRYQMVQLIERAGMRAGRVVRNLLDFSRQEEFQFEPTDLNATIEDALLLVGHQLERSQIRVVKNLQPDLPFIQASPSHLQTVWMNLLVNAHDALAHRDERRIEIFTYLGEGKKSVQAVFLDTGKGISEKEHSRIFDAFFTTKPQGKGTGLGLAISYSIITHHRGTIHVQSREGEGARFLITLPVDEDPAENDVQASETEVAE